MKIYYAKILDATVLDADGRLEQVLPKERLIQARQMKNAKKRSQSMTVGLLLEYALNMQQMTGIDKTFAKDEGGKPYILEYPNLYYNLSHSGEYVAVVVDDVPVGIDVECLRTEKQAFAKRFFSMEENELLEQDWSDVAFTRMWTRKEAYVKALGTGMRLALDSFSVLTDQVYVTNAGEGNVWQETEYYLQSFPIGENGWCSVCKKGRLADAKAEYVDLAEEFKVCHW